MKIEHLRFFMSVVNAQSINQAAGELYISQQQLNNILTGLENEMQVSLFTRSNKGVSLTEDGIEFAKYANKILADYAAMQNYFFMRHSTSNLKTQPIHGKCTLHIPSFFSVFLSDFISKFKEISPTVDLLCIEASKQIYAEQLEQNHLYLIGYPITNSATDDRDVAVNIIPLVEFEPFVFVNKNSPLAQQKTIDKQTCMDSINAVLPLAPQSSYKADKVVLISANIYQQLDSVAQNNTVCILPGLIFTKMTSLYPNITIKPFDEPLLTTCSIVYSSSHILTEAEKLLISFLKTYLQNLQLLSKQVFQQKPKNG